MKNKWRGTSAESTPQRTHQGFKISPREKNKRRCPPLQTHAPLMVGVAWIRRGRITEKGKEEKKGGHWLNPEEKLARKQTRAAVSITSLGCAASAGAWKRGENTQS